MRTATQQHPPRGGGGAGAQNSGSNATGHHPGQSRTFSNAHNRKGSGNQSGPASGGAGNAQASEGGSALAGSAVQSQATASSSESSAAASSSSSTLQLSSLVGATIRLTLHTGSREKERLVVQGQLWCYDPAYGSLVLTTPSATPGQPNNYRIVRLVNITQIAVLEPAATTASKTTTSASSTVFDVPVKAIDISRVQEREAEGVREEMKRIANEPPPGVSELGAALYEALGKTLPVRWANKTIVVMDEVLVEPPYQPNDKCIKSNNAQRKERVTKVLLGETAKLQRTRPEILS